jgi:menaquinol-cytochrome c reductase iron-sulfur subunit
MEIPDNKSDPADVSVSKNSRRAFFKLAIAALASLTGLVAVIPVVRSILPSAFKKGDEWTKVKGPESLPLNIPEKIKFPVMSKDAYIRRTRVHSVWAIRRTGGEITIYSPICTHLGCYFTWNSERERFECPCHASVFSINGTVLSGPAPRPLDTLPHKIENGVLYVKWKEYKAGLSRKVEA